MIAAGHRAKAVSVDDQLRDVLSLAPAAPIVRTSLRRAAGLRLADDVTALFDLPAFDNSAMDGYAVRVEDVHRSGAVLRVVGDIPAGSPGGLTIAPGTAARIMTGAPIPPGANAVVAVECTQATGDAVCVGRAPQFGDHIRRAGEELSCGDLLGRRGDFLTPALIGVLASFGVAEVPVHRRPRVAVLTTGSELVRAGEPSPAGTVYDASATMLEALLNQDGASVTVLDHVPDDERRLLASVRSAAEEHDLVMTTGGISAGAYEVVKQALVHCESMSFRRVAMSPGSPQGVGSIDGTPVLALPGNPSASLISYLVFGRPFVRQLAGQRSADHGWSRVPLAATCVVSPEVTRFVPAVRDGQHAAALEPSAAHRLSRLATACWLLRLDAGRTALAAGALVPGLEL